MMTTLLTAKNILAKKELYDVWRVNRDAEYHEAADLTVDEMVPCKAS